MKKTFYSNGKLLITGEYVVLDGARALALPTKFGQNLTIKNGKNNQMDWKSFDKDGSIWFEDNITFESIIKKESFSSDKIKTTLIEILHEAYLLNPEFIEASEGYTITTELTFPKLWGLGTSSTLINNIAQWLDIDAFELLRKSFGGSGYDIACAQKDTPILYWLQDDRPRIEEIVFNPDFTRNMYFVYLNRKQSSKAAIASYYNKQNNIAEVSRKIDQITEALLKAEDLKTFAYLIEKHEMILSDVLEMQTIQETYFSDFKGVVKSLGAWGGDFVLALSKNDPTDYFKEKGFPTILTYDEMILK
ncbi:GYDIA family GHMP kinase [Flavobacterium lindanitolerans]|uniref:Mevalonate kinase n=1 Tax=Flavobacterium lindanitolerans TaxID=428988 RepID=A0A497VAM5_9FLAO|nr:GYDIA family GHMP kinase [Flavobacterium lindanitolerans]MBC8643695.1 GHMP kinase [Flavobacterium lindanitolerans]PKW28521.1 mevalonate kinase [Flavobacterium lindanitolerans]RLJ35974.1 mevalonate kinase [Flavobacterium lindanitolerans]